MKNTFILILLVHICFSTFSQVQADPSDTKATEFEIGGIKVKGAQYHNEQIIISRSGLKVGSSISIPGPAIQKAMQALWELRLFSAVQIYKEKTIGNVIFLEIEVVEQAQLSSHQIKGVKKIYHDDLNQIINSQLLKGGIISAQLRANTISGIKDFFVDKGFFDVSCTIKELPDLGATNKVKLVFDIHKGQKVKVANIRFIGIKALEQSKLRSKMQTKRKRKLFASSKFIVDQYKLDKNNIINHYNTLGYRDAKIVRDSIHRNAKGDILVDIYIDEGHQYYFRSIGFKGNSVYTTEMLENLLAISNGDVYNTELLEARISYSPDGRDISTQYMDNGYLFFQIDPIEIAVEHDSIDLELSIFEGPQATIDKVVIRGNDRTKEHVIRREIRTKPGQKFSRTDIVRSQREIVQLGYFNPESLSIKTPVNVQRGSVDIEYEVEEKSSDQLELSAGWGGNGTGLIGTLGVSFNNFSFRDLLDRETWSMVPQGDGQRLSFRAQTNGNAFQSYNFSFTEPWLGGKKPNSLTIGGYYTQSTNGHLKSSSSFSKISIIGASVGLGSRMNFPDDSFVRLTTLSYKRINLDNWNEQTFGLEDGSSITDGRFNNISINQTITRSTINEPFFPTSGSRFSLSVQLTPPYSLFNRGKENTDLSAQEKFKFIEYHKWRFDAEWYTKIVGNLTLKASVKVGMLGVYNDQVGLSPFERFVIGGDGLSNQSSGVLGYDLISLRGYDVDDLPSSANGGAGVFDKFSIELRYPISLNPNASIYVLGFFEGGNSWDQISQFNPFDLRRSTGLGVRVFLPMFGTLGFDYGLGFDKHGLETSNGLFNNYGKISIILGTEPD